MAYLFDMDGVVLDSMPYHVRAWQEAFLEFGLDVPERLLFIYEGAIEPDTAAQLFCKNGCKVTMEEFQSILQRQKEIFMSHYCSHIRPFPEIPQILMELREKGTLTALVTSSHSDILASILPQDLVELFDCVITGDSVTRRKPHPDPYLKAIEALGLGTDSCLAIENAPAGIESAKRAGLKCIAIKTTLGDRDLAGADLVVNDHKELRDAINSITRKILY